MSLMFNKMAEICVTILDDQRFFCVFTVIAALACTKRVQQSTMGEKIW